MPPNGISSYRPPAMGLSHIVSSGNYYASLAGYRILEEGGNAIDAGVASGIAINVTQPHFTSFAGVAPILIYVAEKDEVVSISGLGRWPQAATLEYFQKTYGEIPLGMARCVVPSACDAWLTALENYGTMTFEQVVGPSVRLAEEGFPVSPKLSQAANAKGVLDRWPYDAQVFAPNGHPLKTAQPFIQKDLAGVFRQMIEVERGNASGGREAGIRAARNFFYKGDIAERMVSYCQEEGGLLTLEDFASFSVAVEKPERGTYGDSTVYTCGPWCQGPSLISVLNIMEGFDLQAMGLNSVDYVHVLVEAMKLAFSDRHYFYGDPDFVDVPMKGLLSKEYAAERRGAIDMAKAWPEMPPKGDPWSYQGQAGRGEAVMAPLARPGPSEPDTSYACVVDKWGNAFSATPSDSFGSTPMVPGLGMIISSRGSQIWLEPDHPSRLEPGKRPRLTPNPSMAMKNGRLFMPFGTPGGDMQVQGMAQMFLNMVDFGLDPQQAVEEPRAASWSHPDSFWPHSYTPGRIQLEGRIPGEVGAELEKRGHMVEWLSDWGYRASGLCGIMVDQELGTLIGAADPRGDSYAVGR
jgi:gamma-glutamyltranspeptidase/glutathione hydrolase